jgi:hypothetical protein
MKSLVPPIQSFMSQIGCQEVEVYNEFSLQHELGIFLREKIGNQYKVQFERPVDFFGLDRRSFIKKELDISIYSQSNQICHAIELKFPGAGQHPEQMFKACVDIAFLEQLVRSRFSHSYFLMFVNDHLFYSGEATHGIYSYFREGIPITGRIQKPTGKRDKYVNIEGSYNVEWIRISKNLRYALIEIAEYLKGGEVGAWFEIRNLQGRTFHTLDSETSFVLFKIEDHYLVFHEYNSMGGAIVDRASIEDAFSKLKSRGELSVSEIQIECNTRYYHYIAALLAKLPGVSHSKHLLLYGENS